MVKSRIYGIIFGDNDGRMEYTQLTRYCWDDSTSVTPLAVGDFDIIPRLLQSAAFSSPEHLSKTLWTSNRCW